MNACITALEYKHTDVLKMTGSMCLIKCNTIETVFQIKFLLAAATYFHFQMEAQHSFTSKHQSRDHDELTNRASGNKLNVSHQI